MGHARRMQSRLATAACALALACGGEVRPADGESHGPDGPSASGAGTNGGASGGAGGSQSAGSGGGDPTDRSVPYVASESVARRVTRAELDNVLTDLLGDDVGAAKQFLAEDQFAPYDNAYELQLASGALIDSLERLADDVAGRLMADPAARARLVPCAPAAADDADCFREVVQTLGSRLYRRPLAEDEIEPYLVLLDFASEDIESVDNDFYTAVELLLRSLLQDPEVLYRIEVGTPTGDPQVFELTDYEIATRLSFLLWGSAPDEALLAEAEAGRLRDADERKSVARRMLADPRARAQVHRFHAMWLGYRAIPHPPELTAAFARETETLIDSVVFDEPTSYLELFTADRTFIDDMLADHYGLPRPSGGEGWVPYGDSGRAGILSHGSVLSSFSKFSDTSPTQRGILIRTRLLCQEIPPPPLDVVADKPPGDADAVCKYDRYEQHRTSPSCAGCHGQMDPIGFGLENYDIAGRFREHDDGLPECSIEGVGQLAPYGEFSGPAELGRMLVEESLVQRCLLEQLTTFAQGRAVEGNEAQAVDALLGSFEAAGYDFASALEAYVASEAFALRREPTP